MRSTLRRTSVAALAVATLTLIGGCGSGGSGDHAGARAGSQAGSQARATPSDDTAVSSGLQPGSAAAAVDARSLLTKASAGLTSMRISADVAGGPAGTLHMEGVEQARPALAARMAMTVAGQHVQVRMIGTAWYVQVPAAAALPGGKQWLSMDLTDLGSMTGLDTSSMGDVLQDPAASIGRFAPYVTSGTYVGTSAVDGVPAKRYDFDVDVAGMLHELMPSGAPSAAAGQLPDAMKESVWLDPEGRPVEIRIAMGSLGTTTVHLSDFGTPVTVTAPPREEVADMEHLMKSVGGMR